MQSSEINKRLSAINNNVDFNVNSIDFLYNIDNKAFMLSSRIYVFIGAYRKLLASLSFRINIFVGSYV